MISRFAPTPKRRRRETSCVEGRKVKVSYTSYLDDTATIRRTPRAARVGRKRSPSRWLEVRRNREESIGGEKEKNEEKGSCLGAISILLRRSVSKLAGEEILSASSAATVVDAAVSSSRLRFCRAEGEAEWTHVHTYERAEMPKVVAAKEKKKKTKDKEEKREKEGDRGRDGISFCRLRGGG